MTHLFFLVSLWSISVSYAGEEILSSLKSKNFECQTKTIDGCSYSECLGKLPSYPRPVLVSVPASAKSLRVHFHGHILGIFPEYETSLSSMVSAFGIQSGLCKSSEVTVFPASVGKCATYDKNLVDSPSIENFVSEVHSALGQTLPLRHVSGHSGGGRTVSRFLKTSLPIEKVSVFDGTYSENDKSALKAWYKKNQGSLILATVKGMSPERYILELKKELGLLQKPVRTDLNGTAFDVYAESRLIHLNRPVAKSGDLKAHYEVLSQTWSFPPRK